MSIVCFEYKACSIGYFMDEMEFWEIEPIMRNLNYCVRNDWEICRNNMWASLQAFSSKKLKAKDIITFPWEKGGKMPQKTTQLSDITEDVQRKFKENEERTKALLMQSGIL